MSKRKNNQTQQTDFIKEWQRDTQTEDTSDVQIPQGTDDGNKTQTTQDEDETIETTDNVVEVEEEVNKFLKNPQAAEFLTAISVLGEKMSDADIRYVKERISKYYHSITVEMVKSGGNKTLVDDMLEIKHVLDYKEVPQNPSVDRDLLIRFITL